MSLCQPVGSTTSLELCSNANPHEYILLASPPWTLNQGIHLDLFQTLWCPENVTTGLFLTTMPIAITTLSSNTLWSGTLCTATEYSLLCIWTHSCRKWDHQLLILSPQPIWWKLMNFSVLLCKFLCSQRSLQAPPAQIWKLWQLGCTPIASSWSSLHLPFAKQKDAFFVELRTRTKL
jgi:hypothetical protein